MSERLYPVGDDPTPEDLRVRTLRAERAAAVMRRAECEARIGRIDEELEGAGGDR